MMACVAERIIAAPFAIIGSIDVVGQLPNFNRFLKEHNVDFELHTAGQYKRTLTLFGENTDAARDKFQKELEDTHKLFKSFVTENRPQLEIEMVATGEHWYGTRALERKLIDIIQTSDDYLLTTRSSRKVRLRIPVSASPRFALPMKCNSLGLKGRPSAFIALMARCRDANFRLVNSFSVRGCRKSQAALDHPSRRHCLPFLMHPKQAKPRPKQ